MAFHVRHPVWISTAPGQAAWAFATLFFVESIARASVATVFPLHAYDLFGSKESVSLAYTSVALGALVISFAIPTMIRMFSRRWSYTVGCVSIAACGLFLATDTGTGQIAAMFARTFGAATLNITLNLYIMDYIRKSDLVHSEPLRYAVSTLAWMLTPLAGVWLYQHYGVWAVGLVPPVFAGLLLALFWYLRLTEKGPIRPARSMPPSPFASVGRFVSQPRLRLAWMIAFARSAFWVSFFVYVPILMLEGNLGHAVAKVSAVAPERHVIEAEAVVFHDQHEIIDAFKAGELDRDFVAVLRFQGPKANGMPELHKMVQPLGVLQDRGHRVALVTDGRMSGASGKIPSAIHVTPEALDGGLIAKVENGDRVRLDAVNGTLELLVDEAELASREAAKPDLSANEHGLGRELFATFRAHVSGAAEGACAVL